MCDTYYRSLQKLKLYIEREQLKGYDPYDILNSKVRLFKLGRWTSIILTQVQKRNPINLRPLLGIKKDYNPKGMGLLLLAYSVLYRLDPSPDARETMDFLFDWLCENRSNGYSGYCWGYNFDWASPAKYLKAFTPSIIVSGFIGKGIFEYYRVTKNEKARKILVSICDFILNDLPKTESERGLCYSYTPIMKDCCHNANMVGAELLAKVFSITGQKEYLDYARRATDFTVADQKKDGLWAYATDLKTGRERFQTDFHQGFVLESLFEFMNYGGILESKYQNALDKGVKFYSEKQFYRNGQSLWRYPKKYPIDIHNQSQGIITFSKLANRDLHLLDFAKTVAEWTINNMQDEDGHFYYRKYRFFTHKTPYLRWGQTWMMTALVTLLDKAR